MKTSDPDMGCRAKMGGPHEWKKASNGTGGRTYCSKCFAIRGTSSPESPKDED